MTGWDLIADTRDLVGESPLWCPHTLSLLWSDIIGRRMHRLEIASGAVETWTLDEAIGCIAHTSDAGLVAATERGFARIRAGAGALALKVIAPVLEGHANLRFNDGKCDRQGRFWASAMAWKPDPGQPVGALWRLDSGSAQMILGDLVVGNGLAWSPDGRTMYLADSHKTRQVVWAFDFDTDEGLPTNRRIFIDFNAIDGRPDGAAIDVDGCYWIAATDAGAIQRYTPGGKLDLSIPVPVAHPTMPAFGGSDLRTIYITSLRPATAAQNEPDGGVFALDMAYQGLAEQEYQV